MGATQTINIYGQNGQAMSTEGDTDKQLGYRPQSYRLDGKLDQKMATLILGFEDAVAKKEIFCDVLDRSNETYSTLE